MTATITVTTEIEADGLSLEATQQKYAEEAQKRLRPDGPSQFVTLNDSEDDRLRLLSLDPWVDHEALNKRPSPVVQGASYKFLILGAGFGGLQFAIQLIESGLATRDEVRFLDAAGGFGGTWYWNRYPGLHCDVESYIYMPLLEETGYMPTRKYAPGAEIREHAERIARHWNLSDTALFRAEVQKLQWDDDTKLWNVNYVERRGDTETPIPQTVQAQYVYLAGGVLTAPQVPKLPGLSSFSGEMFHTARWNYRASGGSQADQRLHGFRGKRVAVIGTAATAIGVIPEIARYAKELFVVQRTPAYVKPRNQQITDPEFYETKIARKPGWQWERQLNCNSFITNSAKPGEENMVADGWTDMPAYSAVVGSPSHGVVDGSADSLARHIAEFNALDLPHMNAVRARIDKVVQDPDIAEKLKPWYNSYCKRPTFSDEYLKLFNEPHVHLVDTDGQGPSAVTSNGLVVNNQELNVDVIVFSTGYQISSARGANPAAKLNVEILGHEGRSLDDKWNENGAATLHGYATNGFPNLFFTGLSQGTTTGNNVWMLRIIADNVIYLLTEAFRNTPEGRRPILEVTKKGEEAHTAEVVRRAPFFSLSRGCTPGYFNGHGQARTTTDSASRAKAAKGSTWAEGTQSFLEYIRKWRERGGFADVEVHYDSDPQASVQNGE
ncbi:hypothetical protein PV08_11690 [Exophiala spinifera]|uniref:Uncharacterized protein n=1 Tax=Exophiala spinifera TaxID=91928 RepID=A0A0D2BEW7_9EURO|nr:uncharacterized protein PV08_11690 [Exophiala spinifera]KIW09914.1 hypothetical protein PV08_11690 [Exophiala spinifera]